ncbi:hypothetical protein JTE90_015422 [Oedothorax gibbosus]|uniref:Cytochrome P450 n=1 Tax=Oedothorax gibbosus TaxID=931172 RepID=A0AAV6TZZ9_9ARAC|nr:hypothetical protein JTE90_015422 [Oedothorax gibbosus]
MHLDWVYDNIVSSTTLVLAITTAIASVAYYISKNRGLPPGPTGVPFLGYWPFIDHKKCHLQFEKLQKKYGDVFSFTCTGKLYIHLGTGKAVREAHIGKSDSFGKRTEDFNLMLDIFGGGVIFQNNEEWKTNRKFFVGALKERSHAVLQESLSGTSLYASIKSTMDELRDKKSDELVNIVDVVSSKCTTAIRHALFGDSGEVTDEDVQEFNEYFNTVMACMSAPNFLPTGKMARYLIFPFVPGYKASKASLKKARSMFYKIIDRHRRTFDTENPRDIIDDYLKEENNRRCKGDPSAKYFTDDALVSTLLQLIGDGSVSVALFIAFVINAVLMHPEEQDKVYRELVEVVGHDRQPTIEDKSRLTYTNAFIQEVTRTSSSFFPFMPSQECTKETTLRGYRIPKGAVTVMNFYTAHTDPETHENPDTFDPSRFVSKEEKQREDLPISFGIGKRACIGEAFAQLHIFLFVATIFQNFHLSVPEGAKSSTVDEFLTTGKLEILLQPRIHTE